MHVDNGLEYVEAQMMCKMKKELYATYVYVEQVELMSVPLLANLS